VIALVLIVLLVVYTYYETRSIRLTRYDVGVTGLPEKLDGLTILHLSDLHSKEFGPRQARLIGMLDRLEFDIAAVTGDFIDAIKQDKHPALEVAAALKGHPAFYVFGNHDLRPECDTTSEFSALGVEVLRDRAVAVTVRGHRIWVLGVDCAYETAQGFDAVIRQVEAGETTLLLAHAPGVFGQAVAAGIDVVFAGHTHAGQIRLPVLGAIYAPGQGLFPRQSWGLFRSGRTTMIVSAGLGESIVPFRFLCRPEVVLATLRSVPLGQSRPGL
jgi:predicted MPP superfamily phosphohydrolase